MDKNRIKNNNLILYKKHEAQDKKQRYLDEKLFLINKKIEAFQQGIFIIKREMTAISKINEQLAVYCLERKSTRAQIKPLIKKLELIRNEIEIVYLSLEKKFNLSIQKKKSLEKRYELA